MIHLPNKGKRGRMLIGFLPNKKSARETQANPLQHYYCLCRIASVEAANRQAETSVRYSLETSSSAKETNRQAETSVHNPLETSSSTKEMS